MVTFTNRFKRDLVAESQRNNFQSELVIMDTDDQITQYVPAHNDNNDNYVLVSKLSQHLSRPTEGDWTLLKQVLRYLKGTVDLKMNFSKTNSELQLVGYSDADWASSVEDRRSTTGYYFQLNSKGPAHSLPSPYLSTSYGSVQGG